MLIFEIEKFKIIQLEKVFRMYLKSSQIESRFSFPVTLTTDEVDGGFTVTFRDLPEAITQGENIEDALNEAADCLEEAMRPRVGVRRKGTRIKTAISLDLRSLAGFSFLL